MTRLQLKQEWELGALIGGGGFGKVYEAMSSNGDVAAVKLVPKAPGAEREMLFINLDDARNVVPVIESGETSDNWVIVMPRADKSLRQRLREVAGPVSTADAVAILTDIADALVDLDGKVVHRDLKPENVLRLNGHWSLADFGISRYAEATTAPDTRKYMFTAPYAAPEQWRAEHATGATDVYAFGVIAYELLSGTRPFTGPQMHDFREQHLHQDPVPIGNVPSLLAALVEECLYKAPGARPSPSDIVVRLTHVADAPLSAGLAKLQEANRVQAIQQGVVARQQSEHQSEAERRSALIECKHSGPRAWCCGG